MAIGSGSTERPSLRRRLAGTFATLALVTALAQAGLVWFVGEQAEEELLDSLASNQLARSMEIHWQNPMLAQPKSPDMSLYVVPRDNEEAEAALPAWLRALPRQAGNYEVFPEPGIEYHIAVDFNRDTWFYLVYDVLEHEIRQRNLMIVLALSVLAIGALVLLVSGRLARRLTHDLDRLSQAVDDARHQARAPSSFDALAVHAETGRLAEALDAYRERSDQALQRERAFSAAASHELRTPLMRAGSSLDLLRAGRLDPREREIARHIQDGLDEITMLTAALLRVARGSLDEAAGDVDLAELAAAVAAQLAGEARARGIGIRVGIAAGTCRRLDRSALWIVLANLMRNAIRHSGGGTVSVGWREGVIDIEDDGTGVGEVRHRSVDAEAQRDLGLGLSIVDRICEAAGWELVLDERTGGGTRARVLLDRRPEGLDGPGHH
ncbi:MAG: HAMP domain-containing sensor histidine kinase [Pseudomonadota bacterium]|jgi:signal transduction histidine kinase|nr:HAMP domain-containing sensor histidine kinase [Pseudomonadota bacterium]